MSPYDPIELLFGGMAKLGTTVHALDSFRPFLNDIAAAASSGYEVLASYVLPPEAWVDGYYDILGPRARALLDHPDHATREFAAETVREIEMFGRSAAM